MVVVWVRVILARMGRVKNYRGFKDSEILRDYEGEAEKLAAICSRRYSQCLLMALTNGKTSSG